MISKCIQSGCHRSSSRREREPRAAFVACPPSTSHTSDYTTTAQYRGEMAAIDATTPDITRLQDDLTLDSTKLMASNNSDLSLITWLSTCEKAVTIAPEVSTLPLSLLPYNIRDSRKGTGGSVTRRLVCEEAAGRCTAEWRSSYSSTKATSVVPSVLSCGRAWRQRSGHFPSSLWLRRG